MLGLYFFPEDGGKSSFQTVTFYEAKLCHMRKDNTLYRCELKNCMQYDHSEKKSIYWNPRVTKTRNYGFNAFVKQNAYIRLYEGLLLELQRTLAMLQTLLRNSNISAKNSVVMTSLHDQQHKTHIKSPILIL